MINKVNQSPQISRPAGLSTISGIGFYLGNLYNSLVSIFQDNANVINALADESNLAATPLNTYVKAALPSAATFKNGIIIVSDDTGGLTPAFSDGTNWRRTADRNIIS